MKIILFFVLLFSSAQAQFFAVKHENKMAFMDKSGKIIPGLYEQLYALEFGFFAIDQKSSYFFDKTLNKKVDLGKKYTYAEIGADYFAAHDGKVFDYYNKIGKKVWSLTDFLTFENGWAYLYKTHSAYSLNGKQVNFQNQIDDVKAISNGHFIARYYLEKNSSHSQSVILNPEGKIIKTFEDASLVQVENQLFIKDARSEKISTLNYTGETLQITPFNSIPYILNGNFCESDNYHSKIYSKKFELLKETNDYLLYASSKFGYFGKTRNFTKVLDLNLNVISEINWNEVWFFNDSLAIGFDSAYQYYLLNLKTKISKKLPYTNDGSGYDPLVTHGLFHILHASSDSNDPDIQKWGGTQDIYIDATGKEIYRSKAYYVCFPENTKIETFSGFKNIEEIKPGDVVLSFQNQWTEVTELEKHDGTFELIQLKIQIENPVCLVGNHITEEFIEIEMTDNHPVLTENGSIPAKKLIHSDQIFIWKDQTWVKAKVIQKKYSRKVKKVYNIKTKSGDYCASGLAVFDK